MKQKETKSNIDRMTRAELQGSLALATIFFLRMFGLFVILPVFSLRAMELTGATPLLVGIALGAYGITQASFQIPFGILSDHFGRRPLIATGLLVFTAGSIIAALSESIAGMICARVLQGAGAVAAVVMALAADLTREEQRTKAMAMIGVSIGMAFSLAFVAGPIFEIWIGLKGLFWITALLAIAGLGILFFAVPHPIHSSFHRDCQSEPGQISALLRDTQLLRLDIGILLLHAILTSSFVVIPFALQHQAGLEAAYHWKVYLPVLMLSVLLMLPMIGLARKQRCAKEVFVFAIALLMGSDLGLYLTQATLFALVALLIAFFTAFNYLEATLPALVSIAAPAERKGTAMGVYSTSQFLGAFLGGVFGGWFYGQFGTGSVFLFCAALGLVWLVLALTMASPRNLNSHMIRVGRLTDAEAGRLRQKLCAIPGVAEAVVIPTDGVAYLKVDRNLLDWEALRRLSVTQDSA